MGRQIKRADELTSYSTTRSLRGLMTTAIGSKLPEQEGGYHLFTVTPQILMQKWAYAFFANSALARSSSIFVVTDFGLSIG